jgi:hypothetical protein
LGHNKWLQTDKIPCPTEIYTNGEEERMGTNVVILARKRSKAQVISQDMGTSLPGVLVHQPPIGEILIMARYGKELME